MIKKSKHQTRLRAKSNIYMQKKIPRSNYIADQ